MSVLKRASVRQNAIQGPPRWRWTSQLKVPIVAQFFAVFFLSLFTYVASAEPAFRAPELTKPYDGQVDVSTTRQNFIWSKVNGADTYRIVVSEDTDFTDFLENGQMSYCFSACQTHKNGNGSSYPIEAGLTGFNEDKFRDLKALKPGTTYYWKVRAGNHEKAQGGYWSDTWSFTTRSGSSGGGSDSSDSSGDKSGDSSGGGTKYLSIINRIF